MDAYFTEANTRFAPVVTGELSAYVNSDVPVATDLM